MPCHRATRPWQGGSSQSPSSASSASVMRGASSPASHLVERGAQLVEFVCLRLGDLADIDAAIFLELHQTSLFKCPEGLANGRPADPKTLNEGKLVQLVAGDRLRRS